MGKHSKEKQAMKKKQKAVYALQDELAIELIETFEKENRAMDIDEIVTCYVNEERRAEGNEKLLKQYVMMGLGPMIHDGRVELLEIQADETQKLKLVK